MSRRPTSATPSGGTTGERAGELTQVHSSATRGDAERQRGGVVSAAPPTPGADPVFAAFCAAGLWPGLGKRAAAELPAAGITSPDDVTADRLLKLPRVGRQRAERLFSGFLAAAPTYEVVALLDRKSVV